MADMQMDDYRQPFEILNQFLRLVNSTRGEHVIFSTMVEGCVELLEAEAGTIALLDKENPAQLIFTYTTGKVAGALQGQRFPVGQGIIGWVVENDLPLVINDAKSDPRFSPSADRTSGFTTLSAACAPIKSHGQVIGAIEILNKKKGTFSDSDLDMLNIIVNIAALGFAASSRTTPAPQPPRPPEAPGHGPDEAGLQAYQEALLAGASEGILAFSAQAEAAFANQAFLSFLRKDPGEVLGKKCHELFFERQEACPGCIKDSLLDNAKDAPGSRACRVLQSPGRSMTTSLSFLAEGPGRKPGLLLTARDTTLLDRQMLLLKAVNSVAAACFNNAAASQKAEWVLAQLGAAAGASRCYWMENLPGQEKAAYARQAGEWCAPGAAPQAQDPKLQKVLYPKRWRKKLLQGWFVSETESSAPDDAAAAFKSSDIQSILLIPLFVSGAFAGVIGFDNCRSLSPWRAAEASILKFGADAFARGLEAKSSAKKPPEMALPPDAASPLPPEPVPAAEAGEKEKDQQAAVQERIALSQRMGVMGEIVSGVAHNFRNVLSGIVANAQLIQMKYGGLEGLDRQTDALLDLTAMGSDLIKSILQYARSDAGAGKNVFDLTQLLREIYQIAAKVFDKRIATKRSLPDALPVYGNRSELGQVFMNLCTNARDAMPDGGLLSIQARKTEQGVEVVISDTGHGMDPETAERIFDPFFTTKAPGKGTGLGLYTAHAIVTEHGGTIEANSRTGEGATFTVTLPYCSQMPEAAASPSMEVIQGNGEKVLIVDDDQSLLGPLADLLKGVGYQTRAVHTAQKGLVEFAGWRPDVVLLDRNMPDFSGSVVVHEMISAHPGARIVIMSGYDETGPDGLDEQTRAKISGYISKPVELAVLTQVLSGALK